MNRVIKLTLIIHVLCLIFYISSAYAATNYPLTGTCGDNLTWTLYEDGLMVISGTGKMYDFGPKPYGGEVPWQGSPTRVVICEGVESIGDFAFACNKYQYFKKLKSITIPETVTSIGDKSFWCCTQLTSVTIPASVTSIGEHAFCKCEQLHSITFHGSVSYIGNSAFSEISTAENEQLMYEWSAMYCIGDPPSFSPASLGGYFGTIYYPKLNPAYSDIVKQNSREGLRWIPICYHEQTITDPSVAATCTESGLTEGTHCAICNEVIVQQDVIPALGHEVVVDLPAVDPTCTTDGTTARTHCSRCNQILSEQETIPALGHSKVIDPYVAPSCTEDGLTSGYHCQTCGKVYVAQKVIPALGHDWGNPTYIQEDNNHGVILFHVCNRDQSHTEIIDLKTMFLPDGLTSIYEEAFSGTSCDAVIIPDGCSSIGKRAFADCKHLLYVYLPASVTSIASDAFEGCGDVYFDQQ